MNFSSSSTPAMDSRIHVSKVPSSYNMLLPHPRTDSPTSSTRSSPNISRWHSSSSRLSHVIQDAFHQDSFFNVSDVLKTKRLFREHQVPVFVDEDSSVDALISLLSVNFLSNALVRDRTGSVVGVVHLSDIVELCCRKYLEHVNPFEYNFRVKLELAGLTVRQLLHGTSNSCSSKLASHSSSPLIIPSPSAHASSTGLHPIASTPLSSSIDHSSSTSSSIKSQITSFRSSRDKCKICSKYVSRVSFLTPLSDLIRLLMRREIKSVLVIGDDKEEVLAIITRVDLMRFLHSNQKSIPHEILQKQIGSCLSITQDHYSPRIDPIELASEGFETLWTRQKHGVLLSHGKDSVDKFLNMVSQIMVVILESCQDVCKNENIVSVYADDTIEKTLELIRERNVERVFVCDKERSISGEMNVCDIIMQFAQM